MLLLPGALLSGESGTQCSSSSGNRRSSSRGGAVATGLPVWAARLWVGITDLLLGGGQVGDEAVLIILTAWPQHWPLRVSHSVGCHTQHADQPVQLPRFGLWPRKRLPSTPNMYSSVNALPFTFSADHLHV